MATPGKRPFLMHQLAEYLMGVVFIAQGLQSHTPVVPTVMGAIVMFNTGAAKGFLSAFRLFGRRIHHILDLAVIAAIVIVAVQPALSIDNTTRVIMGLLAFALLVVCLNSDYSEPKKPDRGTRARTAAASAGSAAAASVGSGPPRSAEAPRPVANAGMPDTIGRTAGRLAGKGVNIYRAQRAKRRT
ncbi:MAG TPA: hypothetical protein VGM78_14510 [Ilumatobacteraceae bacterium]